MTGICLAYGMDISEPCGATNRVLAFALALKKAGYNVKIVAPKPKRKIPEDLELEGIELITVPVSPKETSINRVLRGLAITYKGKKLAESNGYILQIEFSHLAGLATLIGCSKYILDMHDLASASPTYNSNSMLRNICYYLERKGISNAKKVIVVSANMKNFLIKEWNISEEKIEVIPNGYFASKLESLNLEDIEEEEGMISFIGTLLPYVDLDKIISLAKSLKNSVLYVIGDGPMRDELERKIKKSKLGNIILTGRLPLEEALRLVAKSQVTIYPASSSFHEEVSCPVKVFDYAPLGKAIVASCRSEICRIFKENNAALVSDPSDQHKFIENIHILLENDDLRRELGENARELVKDFTWEKQGEKLVKIYERLILED